MADYILSKRADLDISEIADYGTTNFGVAKSREYGTGLEVCLTQLAESPLMGLGADELADSLRRYLYRSHWVFYVQRTGGIRVVRVLQKNMDFVRHL
jgi:toxin ParE1/3/4